MIVRYFVFVLALLSMQAIGQTRLKNFDELFQAMKQGKDVKVVIYYERCELFSDGVKQEKSPNAVGGMKLETYEYFDGSVFKGKLPSFITSSQTVLINHRKYGYVYNYVKIRMLKDGSVEVIARYLKPRKFSTKFKVVMDETFKTKFGDSVSESGVEFFAN